jgi:hypothetical protein
MVNGGIFPISKEIRASMKRIIGMRIGAIHSRGTLIAGLKKSCGSSAPGVTPPGGKKGSVT